MSEPEKPRFEPQGPRPPSAAEINDRFERLRSEFDKHVQLVRAKVVATHPEAIGCTDLPAAPGIFEAWAMSKLARAEAYLEYYGSLLIAIGKKFQQSEKK